MSQEPESREEAIARLQKSASDLEARTTPELPFEAAGQALPSITITSPGRDSVTASRASWI